jgi:1-acyl-sn-glycerol-3-phosphate acyltransferase
MGRSTVDMYAHLALKMDIECQMPLPKGPKIIAPNHPTTLDPFLMLHIVREPISILVTGAAFEISVFGPTIRRMGHIPVVQGNGRAAFEKAKAVLKDGRTLAVFPEGALSPAEGGCQQPRTGAARLALVTGAPVIPVGIHLDRDRVRPIGGEIAGEEAEGRIYYGGPYAVTVGRPLWFAGELEDREFVHTVSDIIMRRIVHLAGLSAQRMELARSISAETVTGPAGMGASLWANLKGSMASSSRART